MTISIHKILEISFKRLTLNKLVKFFESNGENYAYYNRLPYKASFIKLSKSFIDLLKQFDGRITCGEIVENNSLDAEFLHLADVLLKNGILIENSQLSDKIEKNTAELIFFPTNTCNLRCIYCYASAGESKPINLDFKKAETWINYIFSNLKPEIKYVRVLFHGGGEPTNALPLMKEIWSEVKARSNALGLKCFLSSITNGNFSEDVLLWFIKEKGRLAFSLDADADAHDFLRPRADGNGSFEIAMNNLLRLREAGVEVSFRCTIGEPNKGSLKKLIDIAAQNGVKGINVDLLNPFGRSDDMEKLTIDYEEYKQILYEAWLYGLERDVLITGYSLLALKGGTDFYCNDYSTTSFSLTAEGYLSSCPEVSLKSDEASEAFFFGKINDNYEIEFDYERIDEIKQRKTENIPECKECFLEFVCNAGCAVKPYRGTKNLLSIEQERCKYLRDISVQLLTSLQDKKIILPNQLKLNEFSYIRNSNVELFFNYMSFSPLRR